MKTPFEENLDAWHKELNPHGGDVHLQKMWATSRLLRHCVSRNYTFVETIGVLTEQVLRLQDEMDKTTARYQTLRQWDEGNFDLLERRVATPE